MEKPRMRRVPLKERDLSITLCFTVYGQTSWECDGRGVTGYGFDQEAAYRHWRRRLAEKKRRGISAARTRKLEEDMIARGLAYRKPDGMLKYRWERISAPKSAPARQPSFWGKVFGK
jgi:hypothetical protein